MSELILVRVNGQNRGIFDYLRSYGSELYGYCRNPKASKVWSFEEIGPLAVVGLDRIETMPYRPTDEVNRLAHGQ